MNRKEFIKNCLALGIAIPFSRTALDSWIMDSPAFKDKLPFEGIMAIDAHAHPYNLNAYPYLLHGRMRHLRTSSTVERMKDAGLVASVFAAVGNRWTIDDPSKDLFEDTIDQLKRVKHFEERKMLRIIKTQSDLNFSKDKNELFGAIMAIEGGDALKGDTANINKFYDYGVRLITVLHKGDNEIGFNQESKSDGPITPFGIKVIEKMNEIGMIVDVAHSAKKTLKSIAEVSKIPFIDSHTAPFPDGEDNSFPNRARSWEEMEIIAKSGGVVCTMPIGYTLGKYSRTTIASPCTLR